MEDIKRVTGANIDLSDRNDGKKRLVRISGTLKSIDLAVELIKKK